MTIQRYEGGGIKNGGGMGCGGGGGGWRGNIERRGGGVGYLQQLLSCFEVPVFTGEKKRGFVARVDYRHPGYAIKQIPGY